MQPGWPWRATNGTVEGKFEREKWGRVSGDGMGEW